MRVFVAGATGVIGVRLVPLLVAAGHDVAGMTRSPAKADRGEHPDAPGGDRQPPRGRGRGGRPPVRRPERGVGAAPRRRGCHRRAERAVLGVGGVVLRYGQFYGPGTYHETDVPDPPRIHVDEAARRTAAALDAPTGIIEVVED